MRLTNLPYPFHKKTLPRTTPIRVKRDRKIISVDPKKNPGDNTTRIDVTTSEVLQAVLFDHYTK